MTDTAIIIVADNKIETEIGQTLKNLIGELGTYEAVLWTPGHYKTNEPTISSSNKVICIGNHEIAARNFSSIKWKYEKLNMRYGWVGPVAAIQVKNEDLSGDEIEQFKQLLTGQKARIEKQAGLNYIVDIALGFIAGLFIFPTVLMLIEGAKEKERLLKAQYAYLVTDFLEKNLDVYMGEGGNR